jgi:tetratricopeptide (TPR) repeat protein
MKSPRGLIWLSCSLIAGLILAATARADTFEEANRAFAAGQYAESARGYQTVLKQNGYSAAVLFDLGNAELRLHKVGEAILEYERARWLAPQDPDIIANLRYARRQAGLAPVTEESWAEHLADALSPNDWAWLASGALCISCAGLLGSRLRRHYRGYLTLLSAVSILILTVACLAVLLRSQQLDRAILAAKDTPALLSPFAGARTAYEFSGGQMVDVERTHGGFDFVRDVGGHSGWVADGQVAMVVPAQPAR